MFTIAALFVTLSAADGSAQAPSASPSVLVDLQALQESAKADPANAAALARLSQAYAVADQPEAALEVIEAAVALEPSNPRFLRARATLATWTGRYGRARDSYRQLASMEPLAHELVLDYARVSAWAGDTDAAVAEYRRYLSVRPEAAAVWLELARAESWRGNYAAAIEALNTYRAQFGESAAYAQELASVLTGAGRPFRAQDVLTPLLSASPLDNSLNLTRTVALAKERRNREAFEALAVLRRIGADPQSIRTAERVLRAELASAAEPRVSVYSDSDRLTVQRFTPAVTVALRTGTGLSAGYERARLEAAPGSGLDQRDGAATADVEQAVVGVSQKVGRVSFGAQVGHARAEGHERTTYTAGFNARPADTVFLSVDRMEGLFVVSPRTVGLGLTQVAHRVQGQFTLGMRYHLAVDATHQALSDGNDRLEITVSPRRTMARRAWFNLDLGFSAYRLETTHDLDNGYYDPRRYEHYAITAFPYFKLHENAGLALTLAGGGQRDSSTSSFQFGGTVSAEATVGIYAPWVLKVNGSATLNQRLESGAFRGLGGSVALGRRF
jgi:tetratricopeptide (TPR) repeat protein